MALLTPEEVAERLRVSRITVWRLMAEGALPGITVRRGRRRLVRIADTELEQFIRERSASRRGTFVGRRRWGA